ncbi:MAG: heavy metal translocating P-type ATPase [Verrucomicrobiales bacterium]
MPDCLHCSTPLSPHQENFCCPGCEHVHHLIKDQDLGLFYELKKDTPITPLREKPFLEKDWQWLTLLHAENPDQHTLRLGIDGLSCVACVWLVEALAKKSPGVLSLRINVSRGAIEIDHDAEHFRPEDLAASLYKIGYELTPRPQSGQDPLYAPLTLRLGICGALAMNTMLFTLPRYTGMDVTDELHELFTTIVIASSLLTFLIGGSHFFQRAWQALRIKRAHLDLPVSVGLILALLGSIAGWATGKENLFYFDFVAIFTFLMLAGRHIQNSSLRKARTKFGSGGGIPPAYRTTNGEHRETADITAGEQLLIPPGTVLPTSSKLLSPAAECSLAWITGEPATHLYHSGDILPAGAVNQSRHTLHIETDHPVDHSHYIHRIEPESHSPRLERWIRTYLLTVLAWGALAGAYWLSAERDWVKALQVMISIYVVSCPCGIGLALPLLATRFNKAAQHIGVFPLTSTLWSRFHHLRIIVFDKTGTLTLDRPQLANPAPLDQLPPHALHALFTLTRQSLHPLSRSLFSALLLKGHSRSPLRGPVTEEPGIGSSLPTEHGTYQLSRPSSPSEQAACTLYLDGTPLTTFHFTEKPRPRLLQALRDIAPYIPERPRLLSGDREASVARLAKKLKPSHCHAGLSPEEKLHYVRQWQKTGDLFYLGDGINDLPAMREARLSAAPFANLNLVTKDADMLYTDESFTFLPKLFHLATQHRHLSRQLLTFTLGYNAAALIAASTGLMSPLIAAIIMPLSSLISLLIVNRPLAPASRNKSSLSFSKPVLTSPQDEPTGRHIQGHQLP